MILGRWIYGEMGGGGDRIGLIFGWHLVGSGELTSLGTSRRTSLVLTLTGTFLCGLGRRRLLLLAILQFGHFICRSIGLIGVVRSVTGYHLQPFTGIDQQVFATGFEDDFRILSNHRMFL